jgi:hypothetical protein
VLGIAFGEHASSRTNVRGTYSPTLERALQYSDTRCRLRRLFQKSGTTMEGEKIRNARGGEMKIWIRKQQKPSEK